jgi:hypothetical protein
MHSRPDELWWFGTKEPHTGVGQGTIHRVNHSTEQGTVQQADVQEHCWTVLIDGRVKDLGEADGRRRCSKGLQSAKQANNSPVN